MDINELITKHDVIPKGYNSQIKMYKKWCTENKAAEGILSLRDFLFYSLENARVKKSTWELRLEAVKSYLATTYGVDAGLREIFQKSIQAMRAEYKTVERKSQTIVNGAPLVDKEIILERITKLPTRQKAICLVHLDTANKPSEMVCLKISDFDFENNTVHVYIKKSKRHHIKNLHPRTSEAILKYIHKFNLSASDYFVGRFNHRKMGLYESVKISETGYSKALKSWVGVNSSTILKSQISAMHEAGADLATIKKQTGLYCTQTIVYRHLNVSDQTVSKYL